MQQRKRRLLLVVRSSIFVIREPLTTNIEPQKKTRSKLERVD